MKSTVKPHFVSHVIYFFFSEEKIMSLSFICIQCYLHAGSGIWPVIMTSESEIRGWIMLEAFVLFAVFLGYERIYDFHLVTVLKLPHPWSFFSHVLSLTLHWSGLNDPTNYVKNNLLDFVLSKFHIFHHFKDKIESSMKCQIVSSSDRRAYVKSAPLRASVWTCRC